MAYCFSDCDAGFIASELAQIRSKPNQIPSHNNNNNNNPNVSGPYIHISTCYTGGLPKAVSGPYKKPPVNPATRQSPSLNSLASTKKTGNSDQLELSNYDIGDDSVFLPHGHNGVDEDILAQRLKDQSLSLSSAGGGPLIPPDRPPKPAHLVNRVVRNAPIPNQRDNYANSEEMEEVNVKNLK